jgi:hypothetical protein
MRSRTVGLALSAVLGIGLPACTTPPTVVPVVQQPPAAPPRPPPARPSPPASITSSWSFNENACSAKASGSGLSLDVTASSTELSIVVHALRRVPLRANAGVRIAFIGRSGNWIVTGRLGHSRQIAAVTPLNEDAVSRVLVLLSGGVIRINNGRVGLPIVRVPDAGQPGRSWFECVKRRLFQ